MLRVAVIGAGIIGASVAFRLAQGGEARVFVVERSRPGSGTTSASFAWANANEKTPRDYFELNHAGLEEHFRLRDQLPDGAPWLHPGGNIEWAEEGAAQEELDRRIERLRSWGYAVEWCKALRANEILEPNVAFPGPETPIAFFQEEAWVDAPRLANTLVELARRQGAEVRFSNAVESIETADGCVSALRLQSDERLPVDAVVNAAGWEADRVAALFGRTLPLKPSKGLILGLVMEEAPIGRVVHSQHVNLRPNGPGRVVAHHGSLDRELENDTARRKRFLCQELLDRARLVVPALESAKAEGARIGVRPIPEDGRPCVGAVPSLPRYYEAVTHSGVTLGPLLGRLLAREIRDDEVDALLSPFRPDRFPQRRGPALP
jgi:glycine/D-amino acid oxidase-like deaminating enzyme